MKKVTLIILLSLFFATNGFSQSNTINYEDPIKEYFKTISFKIGTGVIIPQNQDDQYIGISPLIDLSVDFPLKRKKSIELSLQFAVPNQNKDFIYIRDTDTITAKNKLIILNIRNYP